MMIVFFLIVLFLVWAFTGGPSRTDSQDKPFIKEYTTGTIKVQNP
ncbi:MAG: hypothetical protein V4665_01510 [Patescibacteria group bacterium]